MSRNIIYALLGLSLILSGCMIGPDYRRPSLDMPQTWRFSEGDATAAVDTRWWEQFGDPVLNGLVTESLAGNKDVRIAAARVEQFRGSYVTTRAALFPNMDAGAAIGRQRATERGASPLGSSVKNPVEIHQANFSAGWEIDLWGKLRRATEAARAEIIASEEGRRGVILSLVSSVVSGYINLRNLDRQREIAVATAKSREASYDLFKLRFSGGIVSELELNQVKSQYEQALAAIPDIEKNIANQENALSLLLGRNPGPISRGKTMDEMGLPVVPSGLPSDLLERRPDILQAEQELVAANARIGVAKSQYFPSISLTGAFGWSSHDLSHLFTGPARTWSWTGSVAAPVFTAGAISGQVASAEAQRTQALISYQKTVQNAFSEVDDALSDRRHTAEKLAILGNQVESLGNYSRIARLRYENGYTSYIEVLDADRSLFDAELEQARTKAALFQSLVNLYKTMGGGWVADAETLTVQTDLKIENQIKE